jgi:hypothetical protein
LSDFLTLVQDYHRESGASGIAPTTVIGQTGENARLVSWIKQADRYVQDLWHRWSFLRFEYSAPTVASQRDITKPSTIQTWDLDTFFIDGDPMEAVHYNDIKREVFDTTIEDIPWRVIIMPNGDLRFDPVPDAVYTITADAYLYPVSLAANIDVSLVPEALHQVIIGRALILYGNYENAPEIKDQGEELYEEFLGRLESLALPSQDGARYKGSGGFFEVIAE